MSHQQVLQGRPATASVRSGMLSSIFLKTLRDQRRSMVWWSLGAGILVGVMVGFYPTIEGIEGFQELVDQYPDSLMAMFGASDLANIATPAGYLNAELFGFMVPMLMAVFAVGRGSGAVAGEERAGTMELLLSQPVSRNRLVLEKYAAMTVSILELSTFIWIVLVVGARVVGMDIGAVRLAEMCLSLALLGLAFGGVAFAVGAVTGRHGLSVAVGASVVAGGWVLNTLSLLSQVMEPAKWLSLMHYYNGDTPLVNGLNPAHAGVMLVVVLVCLGVAHVGFQRRDLRV